MWVLSLISRVVTRQPFSLSALAKASDGTLPQPGKSLSA
jgi:hypothetical protein